MRSIRDDIDKVLLGEDEIEKTVSRIAQEIDSAYADSDKKLVLVCILKGSVVFMGDLMKKLTVPVEIEFMKASSYGKGTESSGKLDVSLDLSRTDLDMCNLLIVEDIIDSGVTLSYLTEYLKRLGAASVKTCTLLDKPSRRKVNFTPDFCGASIPDEFVIGYGLDYAEMYRALPFIGILKPEVYSE